MAASGINLPSFNNYLGDFLFSGLFSEEFLSQKPLSLFFDKDHQKIINLILLVSSPNFKQKTEGYLQLC